MRRVHSRGEDVCRFILENVGTHPADISKVAGRHFGITRQAVSKHLRKLVSEGLLLLSGQTRNRSYKLAPQAEWDRAYELDAKPEEHVVWSEDIRPALGLLPDNVMNIWQHGFTEMFNNALEHSSGRDIGVYIRKSAVATEMLVVDDGVGIFKKIQREKNLSDVRHAILELSKGKLTTDPRHHSGEGIFFTSRMFDEFQIRSQGAYFSHHIGQANDWLLEHESDLDGTAVWMTLQNHTSRTTKKVFDQYSSGDDYGFSKTVVPLRLAQYGNDLLVSRSQAKRVLARVDLFKNVLLDFKEVESIGQAFADEVFRVFPLKHPEIDIRPINANSLVKRMIAHVKASTGK